MKDEYEKKTETIKFRVSSFDKKMLQIKAKENGISVSELLVRSALQRKIVPSMTNEEIEQYKELKKYQTNFARLSNMIKYNDPALYFEIKKLILELSTHLKFIKNGKQR